MVTCASCNGQGRGGEGGGAGGGEGRGVHLETLQRPSNQHVEADGTAATQICSLCAN